MVRCAKGANYIILYTLGWCAGSVPRLISSAALLLASQLGEIVVYVSLHFVLDALLNQKSMYSVDLVHYFKLKSQMQNTPRSLATNPVR